MKLTKLSLVAVMAMGTAFAGGDIAPVEPAVVEAPVVEVASATTIDGKAQAYYYSDDSVDLFDNESSALGLAATLDVSHKLTDNISANFSAVGFTNAISDNYMEGEETGAFFNVANITATFGDTTAVLGRQLIDTPMLGGFDWLLAPGAFEAYTLVNGSVSNLTLVASYVAKWRPNNSGTEFIDLTDIGDGNNWTVGAAYSDGFNASVWYYNVDAADYTQVYADAGTSLSGFDVSAQFVSTDYGTGDDSTAFGIKVATSVSGFDLSAAYNDNSDAPVGYVGRDSLYTSSWNSFAANDIGGSFKVAAATELSGMAVEASYADYEEAGNEFDLIVGYGVSDSVSLDAIYSNTKYTEDEDATNALELIATYKF